MHDSHASDTVMPVGGGPPRCCSAPHAEKWLTTRAPCTSSHTYRRSSRPSGRSPSAVRRSTQTSGALLPSTGACQQAVTARRD